MEMYFWKVLSWSGGLSVEILDHQASRAESEDIARSKAEVQVTDIPFLKEEGGVVGSLQRSAPAKGWNEKKTFSTFRKSTTNFSLNIH